MKSSIWFCAAILLAGCDGEATKLRGVSASSSNVGSGGQGGGSQVSSSSGAGAGLAACDGDNVPGDGLSVKIADVSATIVDEQGIPLSDQIVQVCGLDVCRFGTTNLLGNVLVQANGNIKQPAFKAGDGVNFVKMVRPLGAGSTVFDSIVLPALPPLGEGAALVPGTDPSSSGVTLFLTPDAVVVVDELLYDTPEKQRFRVAPIPDTAMEPSIIAAPLSLTGFFALAPAGTLLCPAMHVTLPNTAGLPPDAAVEIFAQGIEISEHWAPFAGWAKVSDGHVSADGTTISTDEGSGIPLIATLGVRVK